MPKKRGRGDKSNVLYWLVGAIILLIILGASISLNLPEEKDYDSEELNTRGVGRSGFFHVLRESIRNRFFEYQEEPEMEPRAASSTSVVNEGSVEDSLEEGALPAIWGMEIESVFEEEDNIILTTTGAKYVISNAGIDMWRRIDPKTNEINPRLVARLDFNVNDLEIYKTTKDLVVIRSDEADFKFNPDSLFFIKARKDFEYNYVNLIEDAPWNKDFYGDYRNRMWTDGYGGSLVASTDDESEIIDSGKDNSQIALNKGGSMAQMVFPPKKFDFERLYGEDARPFVETLYDGECENCKKGLQYHMDNIELYKENGFGVFMIGAPFYPSYPGHKGSAPEQLSDNLIGYRYKPEIEAKIREFIDLSHQNGFKVIGYVSYPSNPSRWTYSEGPNAGEHQDIEVTLGWMREFQEDYNLDGWFFDNGDAGEFIDDYNFMKQVRKDIGDDGIIIHHDSIDVWGWWSGLRAIMVDAYVDYTLTGETGRDLAHLFDLPIDEGVTASIHNPNDPYFRYYTAGYGMSQVFSMHKLKSNGERTFDQLEKQRLLAENLYGAERDYTGSWKIGFKPAYDLMKEKYLSGDLDPEIDWPLDLENEWFRDPTDIEITQFGNTIKVSWKTGELANSNVEYDLDGNWKKAEGSESNDELVYDHEVLLENVPANSEFRIRSSNGKTPGVDEIIWGARGHMSDFSKLISYWNFDDNLEDSVGESHGSAYGDPNFVEGIKGSAIELDGDDWIVTKDMSDQIPRDELTYSVWINWRDSQKRLDTFMGQVLPYLGVHDDGRLRFTTKVEGVLINVLAPLNKAIKKDEWHHVVGTFDEDMQRLYIDGVLAKEKSTNGKLDEFSLDYFNIGDWRSEGHSQFNGKIDEVKIFSKALSAEEVFQEYSSYSKS